MTMNSQKGTRVCGNKNKNKKIGPRNHRQVMKKENITYTSPPMVDWNHYQALEENFQPKFYKSIYQLFTIVSPRALEEDFQPKFYKSIYQLFTIVSPRDF